MPWSPSHSTVASPQPAMLQPSRAYTGRASRRTTAPPAAGSTCPGSSRGVEKSAPNIRSARPVALVDGEDAQEDPEHGSEQRSDGGRAGGPADENAHTDACDEHGHENATGSSGAEWRRGGPLHPGARIA